MKAEKNESQIEKLFEIQEVNYNLIEEYAYFPDYKLAYIDKFIYDSLDNVISKKRFFSQKSSPEFEVTYKYKYDNRENWVERIEFFDNTPNYVVTRVINYFLN